MPVPVGAAGLKETLAARADAVAEVNRSRARLRAAHDVRDATERRLRTLSGQLREGEPVTALPLPAMCGDPAAHLALTEHLTGLLPALEDYRTDNDGNRLVLSVEGDPVELRNADPGDILATAHRLPVGRTITFSGKHVVFRFAKSPQGWVDQDRMDPRGAIDDQEMYAIMERVCMRARPVAQVR